MRLIRSKHWPNSLQEPSSSSPRAAAGSSPRPAVAATPVRVRHMHRRAEITHERLHFREGERIVGCRQARRGVGLGDEGENGRRLGEDAALRDERGHPAFGVDGEIVGLGLLGGSEIDPARDELAPASSSAMWEASAQVLAA